MEIEVKSEKTDPNVVLGCCIFVFETRHGEINMDKKNEKAALNKQKYNELQKKSGFRG